MKTAAALLLALLPLVASAQTFSQRGYLELDGFYFAQTAPNDSSHATGGALLRYEAFSNLTPALQISGGIDASIDTHRETSRDFEFSFWDRGRQRPTLAVRSLKLSYTRGRLNVVLGKQSVRWGKTDVLNPTDRFAPRDFVKVVDSEFLNVTAARVTYGGQSNTLDLVIEPRLTPSRVPLLNQRWAPLPAGVRVIEERPDIPGGPQFGARWNHIGRVAEYSLSFYNGYDHLPLYRGSVELAPLAVRVQRFYPQMRMYGFDAEVPLPVVTLKAEAAYFSSSGTAADEYALGVIQLEREAGEWSFVAGYAAQAITRRGDAVSFSPVRGSTRAVVGRAGYTIDTARSVAVEAVVRQDGAGMYVKPEYTQAVGQHWRVTAGFVVIRGQAGDFLGQYRRNSHALFGLRYSF